jgi:hypothetical protein
MTVFPEVVARFVPTPRRHPGESRGYVLVPEGP